MSVVLPGSDRTEPLTVKEIRAFSEPAGPRAVRLDIAGVSIEVAGLPAPLADTMQSRYTAWIGPSAGTRAALRLSVVQAPLDYFVPPAFRTQAENYRVLTAYDGTIFRATSYRLAWWFDVSRGEGTVVLANGELDPAPRAVENMLRSAMAWIAIEGGGLFVHGASIVRDGACRLFYGPSGAGKSTLAALSRQGAVISDDLTLVLRQGQRLVAAGGPFHGTYTPERAVVGVFPVAGFYRLKKDERTCVRPGDAACFADLLGNLPWVVEQLPHHPHLFDRARTIVEGVPFYYLHFRKDEDFWNAIDAGPPRS
jgi:hypothetical protein